MDSLYYDSANCWSTSEKSGPNRPVIGANVRRLEPKPEGLEGKLSVSQGKAKRSRTNLDRLSDRHKHTGTK